MWEGYNDIIVNHTVVILLLLIPGSKRASIKIKFGIAPHFIQFYTLNDSDIITAAIFLYMYFIILDTNIAILYI